MLKSNDKVVEKKIESYEPIFVNWEFLYNENLNIGSVRIYFTDFIGNKFNYNYGNVGEERIFELENRPVFNKNRPFEKPLFKFSEKESSFLNRYIVEEIIKIKKDLELEQYSENVQEDYDDGEYDNNYWNSDSDFWSWVDEMNDNNPDGSWK